MKKRLLSMLMALFAIASFTTVKAQLDGQYYLYNVGAEAYLVGGNNWGTRSSFGEPGILTTLAVTEGKYTISTADSYNGKFLGSNGFVDSGSHAFVIAETAEGSGVYTISPDGAVYWGYDGSTSAVKLDMADATSENAHWKLVSKEERIAALAAATPENPVDATFYLQNPNFSRAHNIGWTGSPAIGGGDHADNCGEKWNTTFDVNQTVTGLPNGVYTIECQGFYRNGGYAEAAATHNAGTEALNAELYANEVSTSLMSIFTEAGKNGDVGVTTDGINGKFPNTMGDASSYFTAGLYAGNKVRVVVFGNELKVGIRKSAAVGNDWTIFDRVRLTYWGEATEADKVAARTEEFNAVQAAYAANSSEIMFLSNYPVYNKFEAMGEVVFGVDLATITLAELEQVIEETKAVNALVESLVGPCKKLDNYILKCNETFDNSECADAAARTAFEEVIVEVSSARATAETDSVVNALYAKLQEGYQTYAVKATPINDYAIDYTYWVAGVGDSQNGWTKNFSSEFNRNYGYAGNRKDKNTEEYVANGFIEAWNNGVNFSGSLTYTAKDLPNGYYTVSAYTFTNLGGELSFSANGKSVALDNTTDLFTKPVVEKVFVYDGTLTFGLDITAGNWIGLTNIEIAYTGKPAIEDVTEAYIKNAEIASADNWTLVNMTDNGPGDPKKYNFYGFYAGWGSLERTSGSMTQEITVPAGVYRLQGKAFYRYGLTYNVDPSKSYGYIIAGDNKNAVHTLGSVEGLSSYANDFPGAHEALYVNDYYTNYVDFKVEKDTTIKIGYECTFDLKQSWFLAGKVALYTIPADVYAIEYAQLKEELSAVEANAAVNAKVAEVLEAVADVEINDEVALYEAIAQMKEVLALAQAISVELECVNEVIALYENHLENSIAEDKSALESAIATAKEIVDAALAVEEMVEAETALKEVYKEYIMVAYPINGVSFDVTHLVKNANCAAIDGWSITDGANTFHLNTWSVEGNSDGSGMVTPFIEDWIGKGTNLNNATITNTTKGMRPGSYKVTGLIRALNEAGGVEPSGVYVYANNGKESATTGQPCANGVYGYYSAVGYVGEDSTLNIGIVIENATVNWVAFKNFTVEYIAGPMAKDFVPSINPENGSVINALNFSLALPEGCEYMAVNYQVENPVKFYDAVADTLICAGGIMSMGMNTRIMPFGEIPYGEIKMVIAEGAMGTQEWEAYGYQGGSCNPELTYTYTYEAPNLKPNYIYPDEYTTLTSLNEVILSFDFVTSMAYGYASVTNEAGDVYEIKTDSCYNWDYSTLIIKMDTTFTAPGKYTMTIPAGMINLGEYAEFTNEEITCEFTVVEVPELTNDYVPTEVDPASGSEVTSLEAITLKCSDMTAVNYNVENPAVLLDAEGNTVAVAQVFTSRLNPYAVTVYFENPAVEVDKKYTVKIAAGVFGSQDWATFEYAGGSCNPELTYEYTLVKPAPVVPVITPADGSEVEAFEGFTIIFEGKDVDASYAGNIIIKNEAGEEVYNKSAGAFFEWAPGYNGMIYTFPEAITESGVYTVTIEQGALYLNAMMQSEPNDEVVFTITVKGAGDGINGVTVDEGNVTVYTMDGKLLINNKPATELNKLGKGLYIINGKKINL